MDTPPWIWTFGLATAVVVVAKWVIAQDYGRVVPAWYAWPGMNPEQFHRPPAHRPDTAELSRTFAYMALGAGLVWLVTPMCERRLVAAWTGTIGLALLLHFGIVRCVSIYWRHAGFDAKPLFDRPLVAGSLGEFWGRRWNRGFSDAASRWIFRPLRRRVGARAASAAVFVASGIGHDLLLSAPAGGGYGGCTVYFALQWLGVVSERQRRSRLRTLAIVILPLPLLIHTPFLERVVLPFLAAIGASS